MQCRRDRQLHAPNLLMFDRLWHQKVQYAAGKTVIRPDTKSLPAFAHCTCTKRPIQPGHDCVSPALCLTGSSKNDCFEKTTPKNIEVFEWFSAAKNFFNNLPKKPAAFAKPVIFRHLFDDRECKLVFCHADPGADSKQNCNVPVLATRMERPTTTRHT